MIIYEAIGLFMSLTFALKVIELSVFFQKYFERLVVFVMEQKYNG